MTLLIRSLACAVLLSALPAAAQKSPERTKPAPAPVQKFDFDDDTVEAGRDLPQIEVVASARRPGFTSLLRVRTTFVPELLKSAESQ
jgi:hypothetical protein